MPFTKDGFKCADKALRILNANDLGMHLDRLKASGIDTSATEQSGRLEMGAKTDVYLADRRSDPDRIVITFEDAVSGTAALAYPLSSIVGQKDGAAEDAAHLFKLVEFKDWINDVRFNLDDAIICAYDPAGDIAAIEIARRKRCIGN